MSDEKSRRRYKLNRVERQALDTMGRSVATGRRILISLNIICGFLFITIFEMAFAWQMARPAASAHFFAENIAKLAVTAELKGITDVNQGKNTPPPSEDTSSKYERYVLEEAFSTAKQFSSFPSDTSQNVDQRVDAIRDAITAGLASLPTWRKEQVQQRFATRVIQVRTALQEKLNREVKDDTIVPGERYGVILGINDPDIEHSLNEILERHSVNQDTRDKRVGPRFNTLPVVGVRSQLEDSHPAMAIFLLVLLYWFYASVKKTDESYRICRAVFRKKKSLAMWVSSTYFHIVWHATPKGTQPVVEFRSGLVFMVLMPYLVVASAILANLHEFVALDPRNHGTWYYFASDISQLAVLHHTVMIVAAFLLANLASRTLRGTTRRYIELAKQWGDGDIEVRAPKALYRLLIFLPFVVLLPFMVYFMLNHNCYFPRWWFIVVVLTAWAAYFLLISKAIKEEKWQLVRGLFGRTQ